MTQTPDKRRYGRVQEPPRQFGKAASEVPMSSGRLCAWLNRQLIHRRSP